jgi:cbb3-type cytochrome oxidase subunit 3
MYTLIYSIWSVLTILVFIGIAVWAFSTKSSRFDEAAQLPFDDEYQPSSEQKRGESL